MAGLSTGGAGESESGSHGNSTLSNCSWCSFHAASLASSVYEILPPKCKNTEKFTIYTPLVNSIEQYVQVIYLMSVVIFHLFILVSYHWPCGLGSLMILLTHLGLDQDPCAL